MAPKNHPYDGEEKEIETAHAKRGEGIRLPGNGGESGIRTHVTLSSKHAFQACAFSHSAISPAPCEAAL